LSRFQQPAGGRREQPQGVQACRQRVERGDRARRERHLPSAPARLAELDHLPARDRAQHADHAGEFRIVLAFDAPDVQAALARAIDVGRGALHAVGIGGEPCGAEVELVDAHEPAQISS
jgi:hypothetical protein